MTHVSGTPTLWRALLVALGSKAATLPLRQITLGGEAVDQAILDRLANLYPGASITHIYAIDKHSTSRGTQQAIEMLH